MVLGVLEQNRQNAARGRERRAYVARLEWVLYHKKVLLLPDEPAPPIAPARR